MATITDKEQISRLVELFQKRQTYFYHACQYKDFKTYLELGGTPSRKLMEDSGLPYTTFETDTKDKTNEVWDKVFGNLADFGSGFAIGKKSERTAAIPNPYGPIQLIYNPQAFTEAEDVAMCLRSAGGQDFDRNNEALSTIAEIDRLFVEPIPNEGENISFKHSWIKFSDDLKKEFNQESNTQTLNPEVSMTISKGFLSFNYLHKIIVDDYNVNGVSLLDKVQELKKKYNLKCGVYLRNYQKEEVVDRKRILQEIANIMLAERYEFSSFKLESELSDYTKDWLQRIENGRLIYQFNRFAKYLCGGTILELQNEQPTQV